MRVTAHSESNAKHEHAGVPQNKAELTYKVHEAIHVYVIDMSEYQWQHHHN